MFFLPILDISTSTQPSIPRVFSGTHGSGWALLERKKSSILKDPQVFNDGALAD